MSDLLQRKVDIRLHRADTNSVSLHINGVMRCTVSGVDKNKAIMAIIRAHLPATQSFDFAPISEFLADGGSRGIHVIYTYARPVRGEEYLGADHD